MATVKDIARLAGVSPSTVSRVMSGDATFSVSEETRNKIIASAMQLKYKSVPRKTSKTDQM
ncbi:MAG: LacI family DNA-binding transcriptional regulator [Gorillibacterium sp.]|nr:LacI family DNA-binding transcriptional regulator [Gorillibacterium sp.]